MAQWETKDFVDTNNSVGLETPFCVLAFLVVLPEVINLAVTTYPIFVLVAMIYYHKTVSGTYSRSCKFVLMMPRFVIVPLALT